MTPNQVAEFFLESWKKGEEGLYFSRKEAKSDLCFIKKGSIGGQQITISLCLPQGSVLGKRPS